jgi:hypothetical protein
MSLMISDDGTLQAPRICAALVLGRELHAARSRGTPTLPALESRDGLNEKGNLSAEKQPARRTRTAQLSVLNTIKQNVFVFMFIFYNHWDTLPYY